MNKNDLEITKTITVSTAHVNTPKLNTFLTAYGHELDAGEGWLLHVPGEISEMLQLLLNLPHDADPAGNLAQLLLAATDNGCNYIRFDPDGPVMDGLKRYP